MSNFTRLTAWAHGLVGLTAWAHGLVGAAVSAAATVCIAFVGAQVIGQDFTLQQLAVVVGTGALVGAAGYLKQSPLPPLE